MRNVKIILCCTTAGVLGVAIASVALARTSGQPFTVQVTVLPFGRIVAPPPSLSARGGASTPLTPAQKQYLRATTPAPSVHVTWE